MTPSKLAGFRLLGFVFLLLASWPGTAIWAANLQTIGQNSQFTGAGKVKDVALLPDQQRALLATADGVALVDIRQPHQPMLLASAGYSKNAESIEVSKNGRLAFVANGSGGMDVLEVAPTALSLHGRLNTSSFAFALALSPDEKTVFIADNTNGVVVADISNPAQPKQIANIPSSAASAGVTLSSNGQTLFIADQANGIYIADVRNPRQPRHLASILPEGQPQNLALARDNRLLYSANNNGGVSVHDVSNPSTPKNLGVLPTRNAFAVVLSRDEKTLLLADLFSGIKVVDVSAPTQPRQLLAVKTKRAAEAIALGRDQKTVWVADGTAGLNVISFR